MNKIITLFKNNNLIFQIYLLIILNYFITKIFYKILPQENIYFEENIFYSFYDYISISFIIIITIMASFLYKLKWKDIFDTSEPIIIKYFVLFILAIYMWNVLTLDYNLYFNQAYHIDRIILFLFFILAFQSPLAFAYLVILSLIFFNQLNYPSFGYPFPQSYNNIRPLIEILILFIVFMFLKRIYKKISIFAFLITVISLHVANYYIPGVGKMRLSDHYFDWIWINDLSNILIAKYAEGWLGSIIPDTWILIIMEWFSNLTIIMQLGAFLMQILALFVFFHKRFSLILFSLFELLHIGIFLASGILFWEWILLNIAIIYVVKNLNPKEIKKIFNYKIMWASILVIFLGTEIFHSRSLAWYDTPLSNSYEIYATMENGEKYKVDKTLFAPYDRTFYRTILDCFVDQPLKTSWSTMNQKNMEELTILSNKEDDSLIKKDIYLFEQKYGQNKFDKVKQEKVKNFLKVFFTNFNTYDNNKILWNYFSPVRHTYVSFNWDEISYLNLDIKEIEIFSTKRFYSHYHHKLHDLEKKSILKIKID